MIVLRKVSRLAMVAAFCFGTALSLSAFAQNPWEICQQRCETRYDACIAAGTTQVICERGLRTCMSRCGTPP
ncbi:hypothetical protein [Lysobacter sp. CA199]|uniref:hypothetical protein n=1 Tax=Lysobacter sp. CA199 TaxID=3455608 RepID=UPI003F8D13DF